MVILEDSKNREYHRLYQRKYRLKPEIQRKRKEYDARPDVKETKKIAYEIRKHSTSYQERVKNYRKLPEVRLKDNLQHAKRRSNPEVKRKEGEKNKQRKLDRKMIVFNHYSNYDIKCNCCGEKHFEFLSIDHVNNDGAEHRRTAKNSRGHLTGRHIVYWLIQNNFPPGFQILCMNCNWSKGKDPEHLCPHQKELALKCK